VSDTQLAVIGAGPGGYAAAFLAADHGLQVTLIDTEPDPGGVCLYRGCIPSKALLHVARVIDESRQASEWGVSFAEPGIDLDRMRAWKDSVVQKMTGGLGELVKRRKIDYRRGRARFEGPTRISLHSEGAPAETLSFDHAILATGSHPIMLPGFPESPRIWDSTRALEVPRVPERLLVVGGGYIGLELGSVYAALGSEITVVEVLGSILPGVDSDLVRPLSRRLEGVFSAVHVRTKVREVREEPETLRAVLEQENGETLEGSFDSILMSVGRRPCSRDLGLEGTRVQLDDRGFVQVDAQRRTAEPAIFAIGDVTGEPMLAHKASQEGRTAVEAILGRPAAFEPAAIPAVVFTDPEIAWAGLTETEAKKQGREVRVARFPWGASGRATTMGRSDGITKLLIDPGSERVLGVGLCGPGAGELIAEGVLAVEMAATARDVELSIHPHPTLSETVMEAASVFFGTATHVFRPKRT
jgi:dihydrolipoamide dehydrogenase